MYVPVPRSMSGVWFVCCFEQSLAAAGSARNSVASRNGGASEGGTLGEAGPPRVDCKLVGNGCEHATAAEILSYMNEVIDENDLARHIRYRHRIDRASWSSPENRWTIEATRLDTGETLSFTTNFLWMCQGYYRHAEGYTPEWEGMADFRGRIVHPQTWPEDLDYKGQRVVVIGSGATAATVLDRLGVDGAGLLP